jgi:hypothetical protein
MVFFNKPRDVTVSTLDSKSSDRGSNPREAFSQYLNFFVRERQVPGTRFNALGDRHQVPEVARHQMLGAKCLALGAA